jgi:hypothetical protein
MTGWTNRRNKKGTRQERRKGHELLNDQVGYTLVGIQILEHNLPKNILFEWKKIKLHNKWHSVENKQRLCSMS